MSVNGSTPTTADSTEDARALADALASLDDGGVESVTLSDGTEIELMRAVSPAQNASKPARAKPARAKPARAKPARAKPARAKPARAKPARAKPARARSDEGGFEELMKQAVRLLDGDEAAEHVRAGSDGVVTYHDPVAA